MCHIAISCMYESCMYESCMYEALSKSYFFMKIFGLSASGSSRDPSSSRNSRVLSHLNNDSSQVNSFFAATRVKSLIRVSPTLPVCHSEMGKPHYKSGPERYNK